MLSKALLSPDRATWQLPAGFFDPPVEPDAGEPEEDPAPSRGWAGLSALLPPPKAGSSSAILNQLVS